MTDVDQFTGEPPAEPGRTIAFQGVYGAYSHLACREARPDLIPWPRETFEDTLQAVQDGKACLALIPIENSVAGRVADIHDLLPNCGLYIVGEHFQAVAHKLLALPGVQESELRLVRSHIHALSQCRSLIRRLGLRAFIHYDTAGAAQEVAAHGNRAEAAISSELAAETYGLQVLRHDIEDRTRNTTRFLFMAREQRRPHPSDADIMTTFVMNLRSVPAALYKALGGFATNGVNLTKLESYLTGEGFTYAQFYVDIEGHPENRAVHLALEELDFFANWVKILGVYPQSPHRG